MTVACKDAMTYFYQLHEADGAALELSCAACLEPLAGVFASGGAFYSGVIFVMYLLTMLFSD